MRRLIFILFILFGAFSSKAQICTGSLGDPTVVINFGAGASIGPSLASINTSYPYNAGDCPNDGYYVITNKTSSCFSNTWHSLAVDHTTGDANGYMMLVNAKNDPGIFYTFSVDNLCSNTTYEFSSFIINMIKPSAPCGTITKPKITFRVEKEDGTLISTYSTGFINETNAPEWKEYGFSFKSPPTVTKVILKLINDSGGGCGNDLALDDITFRPCGPTIFTENTLGNNLQICEGSTNNFKFKANVSSGYTVPAYQWQVDINDGLGWVDIPNKNSADLDIFIDKAKLAGYTYRLAAAEKENITSASCRAFSNPITILVNPKVNLDPLKDIYVLENTPTKINASASGASNLTYKWSPATYLDDATIQQPTATAKFNTTYKLVVTNPLTGCSAEDQMTIYVDPNIIIPNSFTPNGDGVNDLWEINGVMGNADVDISVFNRFGQIVFKSRGFQKGWDGKLKNIPLPPGVYYYIIDTHTPQIPIYKGSLLMIR